MGSRFEISPKDSVKLIVKTALEEGVTDQGQIANILAQCEHETEWTFAEEIDGPLQAIKHNYVGGPKYFGRGYIQITHDYNYKKFGQLLGQDFIANLDLVTVPATAAKIAVVGMRDGLYIPGHKLSRYINNGNNDFLNARRIVNRFVIKEANNVKRLSEKWLKQIPALIAGADPDLNTLPTFTGAGGNNQDALQGPLQRPSEPSGATGISMGICSELFPIEFSLKEALHYAGCFARTIGNPASAASNLGYPANGMQVSGGSSFTIADFNPTVPICEGCLGFPFKKDIRITSPFCQRRISKRTGNVYYHSGTDYGGFEGEEVIAVADGTVVTPLVTGGYNPGQVDIVHEQLGNLLSRSAHILPSITPGTKVKKGDVIGKVGPYPAGGPHLHLELRKDKGAAGSARSVEECKSIFLDPALYCRKS
jgi:murein DD-endopeptidase MepM/ murein hydrolase activator NlpD/predicted chitinase